MTDPIRMRTVLEPRGPAAAVLLTDEQLAALGDGAKTPAVRVTVNGSYTFAGRVGRMGGETMVGFNKATRVAAGVEPGEEIDVEIVLDAAPRDVEVPDDLAAALTAAGVAEQFAALAPSHRREYVRWITEAKKPETRATRVAGSIDRIRESKPRR